jgi:hypothetical protein
MKLLEGNSAFEGNKWIDSCPGCFTLEDRLSEPQSQSG